MAAVPTSVEESKGASDGLTVESARALLGDVFVAGSFDKAKARAAANETGSGKVIATHSGKFHCDEALAVGMLCLLPEYKGATVVRTRDADQIAKADTVVDVGGVYDLDTHRFDHHQKSFSGVMKEFDQNIRLSSAGLVYRHFGRKVIARIAGKGCATIQEMDIVLKKVYKNFIREIDAIDNGVDVCDTLMKRYDVNTNLSARVGHLNPAWNESQDDDTVQARFLAAVQLATGELVGAVRRLLDVWLPARQVVERSHASRTSVHASGHIMKLGRHCPWKSHLLDIEQEAGDDVVPVYYVLHEDNRSKWRIQCMSVAADSFVNRKSMPAAWCGLRGEELSAVSGIPGGVFVHVNGFIGGNETYEGALAMAIASVESDERVMSA